MVSAFFPLHHYQTGKSRAAIAGAEEKGLSEVSYFSAWPLLLGGADDLHPRAGPDGTRPSPTIQDTVESANGKDKKD